MARVLLFLVIIGLAVYAIADISSSDDDERLGVPAFAWVVIVILVPVVGPLAWIAVSRSRRAARAAGTTGRASGGHGSTGYRELQRPAPQPLAPDDDPEFLWLLEQARLKKQREAEAGATGGDLDGDQADDGDSPAADGSDDLPGAGPRA
ncbi:MAG TPA: PLDc N-terminal domain-containing protein [Cellulomonas sp.]